ncbi:hypothetical protein [Myceligenerans crystallogenes]|uniref:Uncharacterized protein n=1 Tax=Myceligenerans crystallogenes TaxID=316335 RepID=A0ABN2NLR2_9MICO
MTAPTWVAYESTHNTGSGALPLSSIPAYLRQRPLPGSATGSQRGRILEMSPTSQAARWMCRRGNRAVGLPLAVLAALAYGLLADFLYSVHHVAAWGLLALFAWNAAKFALVSIWLLLVTLTSLGSIALRTARRSTASTQRASNSSPAQ